ncbi:MAG TPA: SAM-dependent methyltransferase [Pseudobacteroides sp.]|uniref:class I SAM-dependent methyltransferase n=1 Tax=Pseudobacteroides sp. TaxID=1968840 RepID=UPI002F92D9F6
MNKQNISKMSLFLMGLEQRIKDRIDFFKGISAVYKSGTREYKANISIEDGKLKINFNGKTETAEIEWLSARLSKFGENYDSALVTYEERGTTIYIEADNKNVKMSVKETGTKENAPDIKNGYHSETSQIANRDYLIKIGQADDVLKEIGILSENGKIKNDMIRKYNQIDHFVEILNGLLKRLADKNDCITVLDSGCGKSYLLFVLNYYITEVLKKKSYFIGVDYSETVIQASRKMASRLGYNNMEFKIMDIRNYRPDRKIHLAISLHACDTATDYALGVALNNNVEAVVMVPCCQKEILNQYSYDPFSQILKHGILKARMADVLTDGIRAMLLEGMGYKVSLLEYISPLETPKNLMLIAEKVHSENKKAMDEYNKLKDLLNITPTLERVICRGIET